MKNWNYHLEALNTHGCPECGSDDLAFWGETGDRTDADITDHVECHACGTSWEAPTIGRLLSAMNSVGMQPIMDSDGWNDALRRADDVNLNDMADEDAAIVARGIVAHVAHG